MITRLNALLGACCLAVSSLNAAETAAPDDWDVSAPPGQAREVGIDVSSGTWMSLDVSPDGETIAFDLLGLGPGSSLGEAVAFFLYDVPKVLLLLLGIVTLVSFLRSYVPPERVRAALAGRGVVAGTVAALTNNGYAVAGIAGDLFQIVPELTDALG